MPDSYRLQRFVEAQDAVYADVLAELKQGRKRTHWMWFVFPQIAGLGNSATAQRYAISSLAEAQSYLAHPLLGPRLEQCTARVTDHKDIGLKQIFGFPDDMKFKSSMTLFAVAAGADDRNVYAQALAQLCGGERDARTLELLSGRTSP
jgi:uncharacterized protein (DUF1810 family)